jgi:catalase
MARTPTSRGAAPKSPSALPSSTQSETFRGNAGELQPIGRMVLNRWPDNFFAETEQVAFLPSNLIPGIDFSDDPLLQGRLFSYLDTQKSRLGTTNFHQIPVNAPKAA